MSHLLSRILPGILMLSPVLPCAAADDDKSGKKPLPLPIPMPVLETANGAVYLDVRVQHVDPDGLRIRHSTGLATIRTPDLPEDIRQRYGLTIEAAEAHQAKQREAADAAAAAERDRREVAEAEAQRTSQDDDTMALRRAWFAEMSSGAYEYIALESAMRTQAALLRDAGREDLASLLEEDRELLKRAEVARASDPYKAEREALQVRVKELEAALAAANAAPPKVEVVDRLVEVPLVIPVPSLPPGTVVPAPPPTPVRPATPTPPVRPNPPPRSNVPYPARPHPAVPHPPNVRPARPQPVRPASYIPSTHTIHGAHLWQPR